MTPKGKVWFGLGVIAFCFIMFFILQEPAGQEKLLKKIDREHQEQLKKSQKKYDSLTQEHEKLITHYRNLQRSRDVIKMENEQLHYNYEKLKRRPPVQYNDAQIDSICSAWYDNN